MLRGILAGLVAYAIFGKVGLYLLQVCWSDYDLHSIDKSFTVPMLAARLFVGNIASIAAGVAATKMGDNKGKSAWVVGTLVFIGAAYVHFMTITWTEYPLWYHLTYVLPIVPVIGLSGFLAER